MTDAGFLRKKQVITDALALHRPDKNDVLDVLSKVGGLDIAAMCAACSWGAARQRLPVVIDGFISVVAAPVRRAPAAPDGGLSLRLSRLPRGGLRRRHTEAGPYPVAASGHAPGRGAAAAPSLFG